MKKYKLKYPYKFVQIVLIALLITIVVLGYKDRIKVSKVEKIELNKQNITQLTLDRWEGIIRLNQYINLKDEVIELIEEEKEYIYYDVDLSKEIQEYLFNVCEEYGYNYEIALAVAMHESLLNPNRVSYNRSKSGNISSWDSGLFQINNKYEHWYAELAGLNTYDVMNVYDNIRMGVSGLAYFKERANQNNVEEDRLFLYMLNSYNMGENSYLKYIRNTGNISRSYDRRILENKQKLENEILIY